MWLGGTLGIWLELVWARDPSLTEVVDRLEHPASALICATKVEGKCKQWCLKFLLLWRAFQLVSYHLAKTYFLYILVALLKHVFFSCAPGWPSLLSVLQYYFSPLQCAVLGSVFIVTMSLFLPFHMWFLCVVQKLFSFLFFRKNCSICRYRFWCVCEEGEFKVFLHCHLGHLLLDMSILKVH